jgi:hypothetical protein
VKHSDYEKRLLESLRCLPTKDRDIPDEDALFLIDKDGSVVPGPRAKREAREREMERERRELQAMEERRNRGRAPYVHVYGRFQNGRSIFNLHGKQNDIGDPDYVPDYNTEHAEAACKAIGHRYVRDPVTGKGLGPAAFGSKKKEAEFGALTGQRRGEWDEHHNKPDPFDSAVQAWERKYGRKYKCLLSKEPAKAEQYAIKEDSCAEDQ